MAHSPLCRVLNVAPGNKYVMSIILMKAIITDAFFVAGHNISPA